MAMARVATAIACVRLTGTAVADLRHGQRHDGRHVRFRIAPVRPDPEQQQHHDAEEDPAVDQVVDAQCELHVGQMRDHDDHVGAHAVGDDRDDDRHANEDQTLAQTLIGEIGVERADGDRRDQVAQAAAPLDDRPLSGRNGEERPFAIDGDAGELQRRNGEIGSEIHQRRDQSLADGNAQKQERQRKGHRPRDMAPGDGNDDRRNHRHERELLDHLHLAGTRDQPPQSSSRPATRIQANR